MWLQSLSSSCRSSVLASDREVARDSRHEPTMQGQLGQQEKYKQQEFILSCRIFLIGPEGTKRHL